MTTISTDTINPLKDEGDFRAVPQSWTIIESSASESQATGVKIEFYVLEKWDRDSKSWGPSWPETHRGHQWRAYGVVWVIKKDGSVNQVALDNLIAAGVWDPIKGFAQVSEGVPPSVRCLIQVEEGVYGDKKTYDISWINPDAAEPKTGGGGGLKPADANLTNSLDQRFGSALRAAGASRAPAPTGGPSTPPPPAVLTTEADLEKMGDAFLTGGTPTA